MYNHATCLGNLGSQGLQASLPPLSAVRRNDKVRRNKAQQASKAQ